MTANIQSRTQHAILNTYKRFPVEFKYGKGLYLYDEKNTEYLDFAGGIAVNTLGHAHPEITETIRRQASKLIHTSNLFYTEEQVILAEKINAHIGHPGKVFFCNSGAEANECILKLARKYGTLMMKKNIITAKNSFHGRTFGGMSATGQDKIKAGFEPLLTNFIHINYNSISDLEAHITSDTAAFIIEGIQGEGGVIAASKEYLRKARELCSKHKVLFCIDAVQCGFFRTGTFQSYTRILNDIKNDFRPDAIAQAKSLGGGFPIGATWISNEYQDILVYGNHGSTFGGNPLACSISNKLFEIIVRDALQDHIKDIGQYILDGLEKLKNTYPHIIRDVRGLGLMIGIELQSIDIPHSYKDLSVASYVTLQALEQVKLIFVPAGANVLRILPAYIISRDDVNLGLEKFETLLKKLSDGC